MTGGTTPKSREIEPKTARNRVGSLGPLRTVGWPLAVGGRSQPGHGCGACDLSQWDRGHQCNAWCIGAFPCVPASLAVCRGTDRRRHDPHAFAGRGLMSVPGGYRGALAPAPREERNTGGLFTSMQLIGVPFVVCADLFVQTSL